MANDPHATAAYADAPTSGTGRPVLVLHSWFGLTESVKDRCNQLADDGFCALAPDLFGGATTDDPDEGERLLLEADPNHLVAGVLACADTLQRMPAAEPGPISVIGFSMGASLGLWLSERRAGAVNRVAAFYGTQSIDFVETVASYQFHYASSDPMIDQDERVLMEASLGLAGRPVEVFDYDAPHFFAEPGTLPHQADAEALAWERTLTFLRQDLA